MGLLAALQSGGSIADGVILNDTHHKLSPVEHLRHPLPLLGVYSVLKSPQLLIILVPLPQTGRQLFYYLVGNLELLILQSPHVVIRCLNISLLQFGSSKLLPLVRDHYLVVI